MRILFITGEYPPMQGGVGDYTQALGTALQAQGADVHVLTALAAAGNDRWPPIVHPFRKGWDWGIWSEVGEMVKRLQPHVLHIQYQTAAYGMHPAINLLPQRVGRRPHGVVRVVTFHDLKEPYLFPKAGRLRRWANRQLAQGGEGVIVTNREDALTVQSWGLRPPVAEIPIGSNIACQPPPGYDRAAWRAQHGVGPDETLLCYFGFLNASKGAETLARTLARLGDGYRLWMVGGQVGSSDPTNRAYLSQVQGLLASLGVAGRVRWTDYTAPAEVSANLLAADLAVLPYRDGASFRRGSLLAALAHGLPIVTTRPAVPLAELVDGETARLLPVDDVQGFAAAVAELAGDVAQRQRLGAAAKRLAAGFTWERIADEHRQFYRALGAG